MNKGDYSCLYKKATGKERKKIYLRCVISLTMKKEKKKKKR